MSDTNYKSIHKIQEVKALYRGNRITKKEAEEMCRESIEDINARMTKIAKEFNKKPKLLTFAEAMRIRNFYA